MAQSRKDNKGRVLRKGETQRSCDGKYVYTYTDPEGKRRSIYAKDIVTLREREAKLVKDQLDGLDIYTAGNATVNFVFGRYMSTKSELRATTRRNYTYMYDHFVRDGFGKKKIGAVKYSDVVQFYQYLIKEKEMQINSLETIHTVLHPTFQLAVRDNIIRTNPTDGAMAQVKKMPGRNHGVRHALTLEQQRAFMRYIETNPTYQHWKHFSNLRLEPDVVSEKLLECVGKILISRREKLISITAWCIIPENTKIMQYVPLVYHFQRPRQVFVAFHLWIRYMMHSKKNIHGKRKMDLIRPRLME